MLRVQAGFYVGVLVEDATISTALTISPGQRVSVSGDRSLLAAPAWGRVSDDTCWLANDGKCDDGSTGGYANCPLDTDATDCRKATSEAGFIVQARGSLSLSYVMLQGVTITLQNGGSLSLASSAVPEAVLTAAIGALSGAGSALRLVDVSLVEYLRSDTCWASNDGFCDDGGPGPLCDLGTDATDCATPPSATLTGTITVNEDGSRAVEGSLSWGWGRPVFSVSAGRTCTSVGDYNRTSRSRPCFAYDDTAPCTVSEDGRCVGRRGGYLPNEECTIAVVGGGGVLGGCGVFDTVGGSTADFITLPDGTMRSGSECPAGAPLTLGDSVGWSSNSVSQGSVGHNSGNGCTAEGLCGLAWHSLGLGGGWQICFPGPGCTNPDAVNFSPSATEDDGSCTLCSDGSAAAQADDGSRTCLVSGCTSATATNYDPAANIYDGSCAAPPTLIVSGGCVSFVDAEYSLQATLHNGKPHYATADGRRFLYWSGGRWRIDSDEEDDASYAMTHLGNDDALPPRGENEWSEACDGDWVGQMITIEPQ